MFIDEVRIKVKAGDGGNGCLAFRREKFVPRGGPSGGDGGRGGDVVLVANPNYNTLLHFRFNPEHSAERGRHGEGSNRTGREGEIDRDSRSRSAPSSTMPIRAINWLTSPNPISALSLPKAAGAGGETPGSFRQLTRLPPNMRMESPEKKSTCGWS